MGTYPDDDGCLIISGFGETTKRKKATSSEIKLQLPWSQILLSGSNVDDSLDDAYFGPFNTVEEEHRILTYNGQMVSLTTSLCCCTDK